MIYKIYYRNKLDSRAPSVVRLNDDYEYVGDIEASNKNQLTCKLINSSLDELNLYRVKSFSIGDVIVEEDTGQGWIFATHNLWAMVKIYD